MGKYVFIETRDPFECGDVEQTWNLALELGKKGNDVAMFLVQNAVLATRSSAKISTLGDLETVKVYADDLSLSERGINKSVVREGITVAGVDELTELIMEDGRKPIWT